ncbi:MAG: Lrp/AsnC family transcriptional regulator [Candidatus Hydrothermarchaeota archaeon]
MSAFIVVRAEAGKEKTIAEEMAEIDQILEVYLITGQYDVLAKIGIDDPEKVIDLVTDKILQIKGIVETRTIFSKKVK